MEATGINACPCAQGLVREDAAERLEGAGFDTVTSSGSSSSSHSRRTTSGAAARSTSGTAVRLDAEDLVAFVEHSMSSPIYELLKRPDELFVVEHAHLNPRFVEDSVRLMVRGVLERYGEELDDGDFVHASQVNFETIHAHDVLAERVATIGECVPSSRRRPLGRVHGASEAGFDGGRSGRAAAGARTRLVTVQEPADVRPVQDEDCDGRADREPRTGHEAPKRSARAGGAARRSKRRMRTAKRRKTTIQRAPRRGRRAERARA